LAANQAVTRRFDSTRGVCRDDTEPRSKEEGDTVRLHDYWLDALATCATAVMLAFVYSVLAGYAAGPIPNTHQASITAPTQPQPGRFEVSTLW
jgi:hypothetical protein